MTQTGGAAPESMPQTQTAMPWLPQRQVSPPGEAPRPPAWHGPQGAPSWPQQAAPPPVAPRQDSTRTIAVIALVVSLVTLLGVVATTLLPVLFVGVLAAGFGEAVGESLGGDSVFTSVGTSFGGQVTPAADGSVAGPTLAGAVVPLVSFDVYDGMAERVSCDPVPHVADGVSVLCRASDPAWFGIVRFTGSDGSFDVVTVGDTEGSIP